MKKIIIAGSIFSMLSAFAQAQAPSGLDSIIVEKYYVSDLNDKSVDATGGVLPINSVTYRIYADLKPGYNFQAAYGVDKAPANVRNAGDHELRVQTTTLFFNNEDRGAINPTYTKSQATNNTVMLDSWLSVGAACANNFGVMKPLDDGAANVTNVDGVLTNNNAEAGLPLTTQDGLLAGAPQPVTMVGITTESMMFDAQNDGTNGPLFSTYNGSWASLNHSVGPQADNKVLIGQFTTDGVFSFKLNIQLGTPTPGGVENWVADSPVGNEGTHSTLTYIDSLHANSIAKIKDASSVLFSVYPNPASDAITIDIVNASKSANNSYAVYSIDGKLVTSKNLGMVQSRTQEKVDLSLVEPGFYFVVVTVDGVKSTKKITKN